MAKRLLPLILLGSLLAVGFAVAVRPAPQLSPELEAKPVTLDFQNWKVGKIFEAVHEATEVDFIFDDKTDLDKPMSVDLGEMPLEQALDKLMLMTKNFYKPIDDRTLLIAPDTRQKRQEYQDQVIRTFHLENADSRAVVTLLRSMLQARQIAEQRDASTVTIKDTPDKVEIAAKLIQVADRQPGEVQIDFELIEVPKGSAADVSVREHAKAVNLARPQLRILNGREASIFIGDSMLVPARPSCPAEDESAETATGLAYEKIGIDIDVRPRINDGKDVTLKMAIGITSIPPDQPPHGPNVGPLIVRRHLETEMRLQDGQTHVISNLPALEHSDDKELILLVTPRVTREPEIVPEDLLPYWVGTEENMQS